MTKDAKSEYDRRRYAENPAKRIAEARAWYCANRPHKQSYDKARQHRKNELRRAKYAVDPTLFKMSNKRTSRTRQLKQYGLTQSQFDDMLLSQNSSCAVCRITTPKGNKGWCVDHDHLTGAVRGILCGLCNTGIGALGDNIEGLQRALTYLQAHQQRQESK